MRVCYTSSSNNGNFSGNRFFNYIESWLPDYIHREHDLLKLNNIFYTELKELKQIFLYNFYRGLMKMDSFNIVDIKMIVIFGTRE